MYYWVAKSDDGAFEENSIRDYGKRFKTEREAYNDMRNAALEKMKWNTEYNEDFDEENMVISYGVTFSLNRIIHISYSGIYTYEIKEERR